MCKNNSAAYFILHKSTEWNSGVENMNEMACSFSSMWGRKGNEKA